jgi:S-formylglutathione hydrolase FrmB
MGSIFAPPAANWSVSQDARINPQRQREQKLMRRQATILWMAGVLAASAACAAEPSRVTMPSESLARDMSFTLVLPDSYKNEPEKRYPVVYVLGGWYDDGTNLLFKNVFNLADFTKKFADEQQVIIVNFGLRDDWYYDAPRGPALKYGTFVTNDLISHVDKNYRTIAQREARAITGFSSGGHGAQLLGFQNPELYGAVGSVYGAPDLTRYKSSRPDWNLPRDLGPYQDNKETWEKFSVAPYVPNLKGQGVAIWMGVGLSDELLEDNRKISRQMKSLGIDHTYHEAPGGHDGRYGAEGYKECMKFFAKHLRH